MDYLLHQMLLTSARRFPNKEALVCGDQRLTYEEIGNKCKGMAFSLRSIGLQPGERVGIYLKPSIAQVVAIYGISHAGGVFVPLHDSLFPNQVTHIANDCGVKGIIIEESKISNLANIIKDIPSLAFVIIVGKGEIALRDIRTYEFEAMCELSSSVPFDEVVIEKDLVAIFYTSGSTGKSKGVMITHANILAGTSIVSTYLEITQNDRILAVLPFSFDAGLNQLTTAFQRGATIVLTTFVFAKEIVQMMLKERITGLAGVPTLWGLVTQTNSSLTKYEFPCLRYITNTGGSLPPRVLTTLRKVLPATKIYLMYGLTEAFRSTYLSPEDLNRSPTSIGKQIPNTEIMVINEHGQPCQPGEIGELVHRGPTVSPGYWGQREMTSRVFRQHPFLPQELGKAEKVCYSGDLVKKDEDGFLYFVGRRDMMIKSSGFRISPSEVEEILYQSGELRDAAVIGVPDELLGQRIKAFVSPLNSESVDPEHLLTFCAERVPSYMVPKSLEVLNQLPKNGNGKVDYPALRRRGVCNHATKNLESGNHSVSGVIGPS